MGRTRALVAIAAAAAVCAGVASAVFAGTRAARVTTQELTITVSDGTKLACGLVLPAGSPPAGGWPGLLLFHGLGQEHAAMETIGTAAFAPAGFASLACDARGTGLSGGTFGLDGPREVQDARDLFAWLADRSDVSNTEIGAFGLSLGGGEVWNAAVAGVPFKAIVPAVGWTSLSRAVNPRGVVKVGEVEALAEDVPGAWDPALARARDDLMRGFATPAAKAAEAARSTRPKLRSLHAPTLILQGRHDFLFDLDQALAAYRLLAGPKRLYLGDLGHPPATNPAAEQPTYLGDVVAWFRHYLTGGGALKRGVELAHDPWDGTTTFYGKLPPTRHVSVNLPGTTQLEPDKGSAQRSVRLPGGPLETFGDGYLTVRYSAQLGYGSLVASVTVKGQSTSVTYGAARVKAQGGVVRIPLSDQAVLLPRGQRLVVTVGRQSADGVYLGPAEPLLGQITIGRITLHLSVLRRSVSR